MRFYFSTVLIVAIATCGQAQNIGINLTGIAPLPSAMLDIDNANKGLLIPRVALTATNSVGPVAAPANSLLVYNTAAVSDVKPGYYYYDLATAKWIAILSSAKGWTTNGNTGTTAAVNFLGTIDNVGMQVRTNNLQRFEFTNTGEVRAFANGTASSPIYSWNTNAGSGLFQQAANVLGFSTNGTERFRIPNADQVQAVANGTAAVPSYAWTTSSNTGMWLPSANNMAFSTTGAERLRITNAGWFGLRTSAPTSIFHMSNGGANVGANAMALFENAGNTGVALSGRNTSTANAYNAIEGSTQGIYSGVFGLHLPTSGGGYGVRGTTNSPILAWAGYFTGDVGAVDYLYISDQRFKNNILPLQGHDVVPSVMKLRPTSYKLNATDYPGMGFDSTRTHFGFIAQELENVFPELVVTKPIPDPTQPISAMQQANNVEGYHLVDYIGLVPILTAAIQEQQRTIDALKERITALEQNR
ncbi:MAG: tail fiber domain-containing protein [Flavobacteriales bacterium]